MICQLCRPEELGLRASIFPDSRWLARIAAVLLVCLCTSVAAQQTEPNANVPTDDSESGTIIARDITVQEGDTFFSIARRELGRTGLGPLLAEFNRMRETAPLEPGQIVRVPIYVPARGETVKVIFVKGTVRRGDRVLQRGDEIGLNEVLTTEADGFATLLFDSGSTINLQPNTEAKLIRLSCLERDDSCVIELDARRGDFTTDVESRNNQPTDFRIKTPYASAAVRGTEFDFSAKGNDMIVGVVEGEVAVLAQDQEVSVPAGFGSITSAGQAPGEPIELLPAPVYRYVPNRLTADDRITWFGLFGVDLYSAQLASDSDGNQVIADFTVGDSQLGINNVTAGDYFLNLRGVDTSGLGGFRSQTRLSIAEIDADLPEVATAVRRDGNEYVVTIVDPPADAPGYEIQIASDDSFIDPLSVDVNQTASAIFRFEGDKVYTRARLLVDRFTVASYGPVSESR